MLSVECVHSGCQFDILNRKIQLLIEENHALEERLKNMSASNMETRGYALWCKAGEHAFGDHDTGRKRITTEDDDGNEITVIMCSEHLPEYMNKNTKRKVSLKALMAQIDDPNVEVTE